MDKASFMSLLDFSKFCVVHIIFFFDSNVIHRMTLSNGSVLVNNLFGITSILFSFSMYFNYRMTVDENMTIYLIV